MDKGWIKLHRKFTTWEWYTDINTMHLFLHLLLTVNYETKKWRGITIERGSRITSLSKLADETKLSIKQMRTSLEKLEKTQNVARKGTRKYTHVSICNYNEYQSEGARYRAKEGHGEGTVRAITKERQERKEERGALKKNFSIPTIAMLKSYCKKRNNSIDYEHFHDYYEASGWKLANGSPMKDWKANIRN